MINAKARVKLTIKDQTGHFLMFVPYMGHFQLPASSFSTLKILEKKKKMINEHSSYILL